MRNPLLLPLSALAFLIAIPVALGLSPTEWKNRQNVDVPAAGLVRIALDPPTLDAAEPSLRDLRLIGGDGRELPCLLETNAPLPTEILRPAAFTSVMTGTATQLVIATGTKRALDSLELETPAPQFIKAARVEISDGRGNWSVLSDGTPVFRQWGAQRLRLALSGTTAPSVRVTLDDSRSAPVPFAGAFLTLAASAPPPARALDARIVRREEFAGETVLTVAFQGRHARLAAIRFDPAEPVFNREVSVGVRRLENGVAIERRLADGAIFRLETAGLPTVEQLDVPINGDAGSRELVIRIRNGDSPPLALTAVRLTFRPGWLVFRAPAAGRYALLSGNPRAAAPRYDLGLFAGDLRRAAIPTVTPGPLEPNPGYNAPEALADVPLGGAPFVPTGWSVRRDVRLAAGGVEELELDPAALAEARADLGDLRLVRDGRQVPYVIERPGLARLPAPDLVSAPDPGRPALSRWKLRLPRPRLPLARLVLASNTPLFQRSLRVYENLTDDRGEQYESTLGQASWVRTPDAGAAPCTLTFSSAPRSDTLFIETDNGDNPAISLRVAEVDYPAVRLIFKAGADDTITLCYGQPGVPAPQYDLSLVAGQLLSADRTVARLAPAAAEPAPSPRNFLDGLRGGPIFWAALSLVVIVLLVTVAKLLPKPPPSG